MHPQDTASTAMLAHHTDAWYRAIASRRSRRRFDGQACTPAQLESVAAICAGFRPYPDARVEFVHEPGADVFRGIVGSYGKVAGAPHLLVVIASRDSEHAQQHAGFIGEAAILEATSAGLDTCWVGGFFKSQSVCDLVDLQPGEKVVAVSPLGHAEGTESASEHLMQRMAHSHSRKPLDLIAPTLDGEWPRWARTAVGAARLAPSAMNRQPWRFRMKDGALMIARNSGAETPKVTKALDCGIAMLHAQLGAASAGVIGGWEDLGTGLDVARFTPTPPQD